MKKIPIDTYDESISSIRLALSDASYYLEAMKFFGPLKFLNIDIQEEYVANLEVELISFCHAKESAIIVNEDKVN